MNRKIPPPFLLLCLFCITAAFYGCTDKPTKESSLSYTVDSTYYAMNPMDIEFDEHEMKEIQAAMGEYIKSYQAYREVDLPNHVVPALHFNPLPAGFEVPAENDHMAWNIPQETPFTDIDQEYAFLSITELAAMIHSGEVSSLELTNYFLQRLETFDPELHCVISLTRDYAIARAREMDQEMKEGKDRGILHGIPYGIKDLFAFPGYPTSWGATAYKDQVIDVKSGVVSKLEDAGAILIAKLSLGALAMGDVWFADTTRNPWNTAQGSSGSSAGSAAATAAGLVPFAIGTETYGSIVSPSTRCGTTGLRPSYGRVSRHGAMALSWSMDKVGPICRSAYDCAIVFDAIRGVDGLDHTIIPAGFTYKDLELSSLRIGYLKSEFDKDYLFKNLDKKTLSVLKKLGASLEAVDIEVGLPIDAMTNILLAEAAAAFDQLTRSNRDSLLVQQGENAWPALFRAARFMPAVEYIQANRIRTLLIEEYNNILKEFDVIVVPSFRGTQLPATNLTGHPAVVVPNGFTSEGALSSITFLGNLFDEGTILAVAQAYQDATPFDEMQPPLFAVRK